MTETYFGQMSSQARLIPVHRQVVAILFTSESKNDKIIWATIPVLYPQSKITS